MLCTSFYIQLFHAVSRHSELDFVKDRLFELAIFLGGTDLLDMPAQAT